MIWAFRQLLTPCNYLRIRHGDGLLQSKAVYDVVLPAILSVSTLGIAVLFQLPLDVVGSSGLFTAISGLLAILIGFYMAALAAVSTFTRPGIDNKLPGHDALLKVRLKDVPGKIDKQLSYRQFISYLFGYASFLSFVIYVALFLAKGIWPKIVPLVLSWPHGHKIMYYGVEPLSFIVIVFFMWQLFLVSLLGIYFLAERIQELSDT